MTIPLLIFLIVLGLILLVGLAIAGDGRDGTPFVIALVIVMVLIIAFLAGRLHMKSPALQLAPEAQSERARGGEGS